MLDIIFISYDEPNADANWMALKQRFPHARRVHGIKGIAAAHMAAARRAATRFFYVVDADAEIAPDFDFSYKPPAYDQEYVHVWMAQNPATGTAYGYGGVKLFCRDFFKNIQQQLDFTTTLTAGIKIMPQIAGTTHFNSDAIRSFRGAFREAVKLALTSRSADCDLQVRQEAALRLKQWCNPVPDCNFREFIIAGALAGLHEVHTNPDRTDLMFINDHDLMVKSLLAQYPEIDLKTDINIETSDPMKNELFFITRISSVLYDPFVYNNLPMRELRDALSDGQLLSKHWLLTELKKIISERPADAPEARVAILGGWIGTLALLINSSELPVHITSIDLDERACTIASKLNYGFNFSARTGNMYHIDYNEFDIIINTASEHIPDIAAWRATIPADKIIIAQNNDFVDGDGHVSTVNNSSALRPLLNFKKVLYEGSRHFPQYKRFMLIGRT